VFQRIEREPSVPFRGLIAEAVRRETVRKFVDGKRDYYRGYTKQNRFEIEISEHKRRPLLKKARNFSIAGFSAFIGLLFA